MQAKLTGWEVCLCSRESYPGAEDLEGSQSKMFTFINSFLLMTALTKILLLRILTSVCLLFHSSSLLKNSPNVGVFKMKIVLYINKAVWRSRPLNPVPRDSCLLSTCLIKQPSVCATHLPGWAKSITSWRPNITGYC